ncbi:hypothetical protein [Hydrogenophaga sp.]|uniref:hypothetical protein n=1 Tax=Hydrogenophaga sp. TaxID=1904254 RepID=UPI0035B3BF08
MKDALGGAVRESLREFIYREAGPDEGNRLALIRHLAPLVLIAGGYDFNELRQLIQYGPGWESSSGSEYVSGTWPEVPVNDPLKCITIRPFNPDGYTTTPYELVALLAGHLRDLLEGAETAPDYDGIIRFGYIEPESMGRWRDASERWRASRTDGAARPMDAPRSATALAVRVHTARGSRTHWLDAVVKTARDRAPDPADKKSVWYSLCGLALSDSPPEPLMGMLGKDLKYRVGNRHELYTYDAFAKYWKRREPPED